MIDREEKIAGLFYIKKADWIGLEGTESGDLSEGEVRIEDHDEILASRSE